MAERYDHLRAKAIELRTQHRMTLDEIVERLGLPKTTVYYWIKDIPIPYVRKQTPQLVEGRKAAQAKYTALREAAYQQGLAEAPELLRDLKLRDFVVLYMAEGSKRDRNRVSIVNSDPRIVKIAFECLNRFARKLTYALQYHADHNPDELCQFWGNLLGIDPRTIRLQRKSNSGELSRRHFRSVHGLFTLTVDDTYLRARLQAWMDFIKNQW